MTLQSLSAALLIPVLVLAIPMLYTPSSIHAEVELPRHTPGFPEIENVSLRQLAEVLNKLENIESLSQLRSNQELRNSVLQDIRELGSEGLLSPEDVKAIEKVVAGSRDVSELTKLVEDPEVRGALRELASLYREGGVSREQLEKVLELVSSRYSSGAITARDYLLALETIRRIAELSNETELANLLDRETLSVLRTVLSSAYSGSLLEALSQLSRIAGEIRFPRALELDLGTPIGRAISSLSPLPATAFSTAPRIPLITLLVLAITVAAVIALGLLMPRLARAITALTTTLKARTALSSIDLRGLPKPIELYWRAVDRVARATGIVRGDTQTHREYLRAVEEKLGRASKPFSEITMGYEIARFGGAIPPELLERMEREYRELVEKL